MKTGNLSILGDYGPKSTGAGVAPHFLGNFDGTNGSVSIKDDSIYLKQVVNKGYDAWDSSTVLYLRFNGANTVTTFPDETGRHTVTAVGTAQIATAQSKFGGASLSLDGNSDYITTAASTDFNFGGGDFTVDCWAYLINNSVNYSDLIYYETDATHVMVLRVDADNTLTFGIYYAGWLMSFNDPNTFPLNQWVHVAVTRSGDVWRIFVNGVVKATTVYSGSIPVYTTAWRIGYDGGAAGRYWYGYIDEYRVTKGLALWTSDFSNQLPQQYGYNDSVTVLLLLCDGPDAGTVLTDVATGKVATFVGTAQLDSAQYKFGSASLLFDGNSDYITFPHSADWDFGGGGKFTIDFWIRFNATTTCIPISQWDPASSTQCAWQIVLSSSFIYWQYTTDGSTLVQNSRSWSPTTGVWYHIAIAGDTTTARIFLNGTQLGAGIDMTGVTIFNSDKVLAIGADNAGGSSVDGWMDNIRVQKGWAWYTANFVPPTSSFNGAHLSTSTKKYGASCIEFSGTWYNNQAVLAQSSDFVFGTGDFTIDFWLNFSAHAYATNYTIIFDMKYDTGMNLTFYKTLGGVTPTNAFRAWFVGSDVNWPFGSIPTVGTWYHAAVVRQGNYLYLYINGIRQNAYNNAGTLLGDYFDVTGKNFTGTDSSGVGIGNSRDGGNSPLHGYIDAFRITKGRALFKSNFSTEQLYPGIVDDYTKLLLHYTGSNEGTGFLDSSGTPKTVTNNGSTTDSYTKLLLHLNNNVTDSSTTNTKTVTNNNVTFVTSPYKFGGYSALFNGTTAYLTVPDSDDWDFGSGDFTVDWWEYRERSILSGAIMRDATNGYTPFLLGYTDGSDDSAVNITSNGSSWDIASGKSLGKIKLRVWTHCAVVRSGNNFYTFRDGVQQATWTSSGTILASADTLSIGKWWNSYFFPGYLDEIRISKGIARWTANFIPPTQAYGLAHIDTTTYLFAPSCGYFDGCESYLSLAYSSDWALGDCFTIDCWSSWSMTATTTGETTLVGQRKDGNNLWHIFLYDVGTPRLYFSGYAAGATIVAFYCPFTPVLGTFYHIAVVRIDGGNAATSWRMFINGVSQTLAKVDGTWSNTVPDFGSGELWVGAVGTASFHSGYIDEFRISKGIARWTSDFTPPNSPYGNYAIFNSAVRYVGPTCTYTTIQAAMNACNAGDTILVNEGTYNEAVTFTQDYITLKALGSKENILIAQVDAIAVSFSTYSGCIVEGFTIKTTGATTYLKSALYSNNASVSDYNYAINCNIQWSATVAIANAYGVYTADGNFEFRNCLITATNTYSGASNAGIWLFMAVGASHIINVKNCVLTINNSTTDTGDNDLIFWYSSSGGVANFWNSVLVINTAGGAGHVSSVVYPQNTLNLYSNTLTINCSGAGGAIILKAGGSAAIINSYNNILNPLNSGSTEKWAEVNVGSVLNSYGDTIIKGTLNNNGTANLYSIKNKVNSAFEVGATNKTNNAVAVTIGAGPAGANAAIQGWMKININGTARYIPYW